MLQFFLHWKRGVISYLKKIIAIFFAFERIFGKNRNIFPEKGAGGGVKGRLELFQKFIDFGRDGLPLLTTHVTQNSKNCDALEQASSKWRPS